MRIDAIDIARGYTVLIMPMVHVFVVFGNHDTQFSLPGVVVSIFAEETGAPLFMFLMGLSAGLNRKNSPRIFFKRSLELMLLAFLLNFLKFVLPFILGLLPSSLLLDLGISNSGTFVIDLLLIGDILHLASLSFFVFALCSFMGRYQWIFESLLLLMLLICVWNDWSIKNSFGITAWIAGELPQAFFPLLPWLFYPLTGKLFSILIKIQDSAFRLYGLAGVVLLLITFWLFKFSPHGSLLTFYKPDVGGLFYYCACSLIWLFVCDRFSRLHVLPTLKGCLRFLSRHITIVYFIQWLVIFWTVGFVGYQQHSLLYSFLFGVFITILTVLLTGMYMRVKKTN